MRGDGPPHTPPALLTDGRSGFADVSRLKTFRAASDLELHAVPFGQALEALSLDGAEVNEHVLAALLRDEAEALRVVEPLHCSLCHDVPLSVPVLWSLTLR